MLDREAPTSSPSDPAPIEEAAAEGGLHLPREPVPLEMLPLPRAPGRYVGDVAGLLTRPKLVRRSLKHFLAHFMSLPHS